MGMEDMANAKLIEFMKQTNDVSGLEAFRDAAKIENEEQNVDRAENALEELKAEEDKN